MCTKQLAALPGYTTCNINALSSNVQSGLPSVESTQYTLYVTIIAWQDHSGFDVASWNEPEFTALYTSDHRTFVLQRGFNYSITVNSWDSWDSWDSVYILDSLLCNSKNIHIHIILENKNFTKFKNICIYITLFENFLEQQTN